MGILTRIKAAALFGCLLFSSQSFAVTYYWSDSYTSKPSATAFCDAVGSASYPSNPKYTRSQITFQSSTRVMCAFYYQYTGAPEQFSYAYAYANRYGDSCPTGSTYDATKGECVAPVEPPLNPGEKCKDQTGATAQNPFIWDKPLNKCVKFFDAGQEASCKYLGSAGYGPASYTVAGNLDAGGNAVAPPTFSTNVMDCQAKTVSSSECTINVAGAVSCNVMATFTGEMNNGTKNTADALCPDGNCPVKEPETKSSEEGCTPVSDGSGGTTCTQKKETAQEGTQQCGLVNGAYKCITKQPYSNGITTGITSKSETLADNSVKVTTVKDSSNTVCTDVKTCVTKTSSTTTVTTTKPNGSTTTSTTCKGACTPTGGGLETTPDAGSGNTGTGSGGGGTGGDGEGEGGDGNASTSDSCDVPPVCDGDPFQCTIIKQAHIDTCKLMAPPTAEQQAQADAKTNAAHAALDAHQATMDQQVNGLLSQFQGATSGGGGGAGKCLPDFQFSVMGMTQSMEFSKVCDSISWVRLMVLAGAYLFAARIVYREV